MTLSDIRKNETLVNQGKLVIRRDAYCLRIRYYRKNPKLNEDGCTVYGWCNYRTFENLSELNITWKELIDNGAIEG